jgi:hypothetical protein
MYLETLDRRSLVRPPLSWTRPKPSPFEEAVRKDSAVHVSLSSDLPVKQPGNLRGLLFLASQEANEAQPSDHFSEVLSHNK